MKKTKVYYTVNGIPHYNEFDRCIPQDFLYYQIEDENIPGNLWNLLSNQKNGYKFCRDDGPAAEYISGDLIFQSSKCKSFIWDYMLALVDFSKNTNHLTCINCKNFCKQKCFA